MKFQISDKVITPAHNKSPFFIESERQFVIAQINIVPSYARITQIWDRDEYTVEFNYFNTKFERLYKGKQLLAYVSQADVNKLHNFEPLDVVWVKNDRNFVEFCETLNVDPNGLFFIQSVSAKDVRISINGTSYPIPFDKVIPAYVGTGDSTTVSTEYYDNGTTIFIDPGTAPIDPAFNRVIFEDTPKKEETPKKARRHNKGKTKYSLIKLSCFEDTAKVLEFGMLKYAVYQNTKTGEKKWGAEIPREHWGGSAEWEMIESGKDNWDNGLVQSEVIDSLLRHVNAIRDGQWIDPDTGLSHIGALGCNIMFLGSKNIINDLAEPE